MKGSRATNKSTLALEDALHYLSSQNWKKFCARQRQVVYDNWLEKRYFLRVTTLKRCFVSDRLQDN